MENDIDILIEEAKKSGILCIHSKDIQDERVKEASLLCDSIEVSGVLIDLCNIPEQFQKKIKKIISFGYKEQNEYEGYEKNISIDWSLFPNLKHLDLSKNPLNNYRFAYLPTLENFDYATYFVSKLNNRNIFEASSKENGTMFFKMNGIFGSINWFDIPADNKFYENYRQFYGGSECAYSYSGYDGFQISVFGNTKKHLEILIKMRKLAHELIEDNNLKYISFDEIEHNKGLPSKCSRFFYYPLPK